MTFRKKLDNFIGKSVVVLILVWGIFEIIFPWIKAFIPANGAFVARGLALCLLFVFMFFYEDPDDVPPNKIETICGLVLIVGSVLSAMRICPAHSVIAFVAWFVIFFQLLLIDSMGHTERIFNT